MRGVGQPSGTNLSEEVVAQIDIAHPDEGLRADERTHRLTNSVEHRSLLALDLLVPVTLRPRFLGRVEDRDAISMLVL